MKMRDLRIGNQIMQNGEVIKIEYASQLVAIEAHPDSCTPIDITEDLLVKMGLVRSEADDFNQYEYTLLPFSSPKVVFNAIWFSGPFVVCIYISNAKDLRPEHIRYVHQFQNLIYDLTQQELEC